MSTSRQLLHGLWVGAPWATTSFHRKRARRGVRKGRIEKWVSGEGAGRPSCIITLFRRQQKDLTTYIKEEGDWDEKGGFGIHFRALIQPSAGWIWKLWHWWCLGGFPGGSVEELPATGVQFHPWVGKVLGGEGVAIHSMLSWESCRTRRSLAGCNPKVTASRCDWMTQDTINGSSSGS